MKRSMSFALFLPMALVVALAVVARPPGAPLVAPTSSTSAADDGTLPKGTTALDERWAGIMRLQPALLDALRQAAREAAASGVTIEVNSGWRSLAYQRRLLSEAVATYGSEEAAARWVAPVAGSRHVTGDAVDVGPPDAAAWLASHGAAHDVCPVYGNEPWHFELRPGARDAGCPERYADASVDPRVQP